MNHETNLSQYALARRDQLVVQEMPDEVLVYDLKAHKAHCLNKTAAFVWNNCDGQTSVADLAKLLQDETGSQVDEDVIWFALDNLSKARLLEEKVAPPAKDGLSRRRMMRRLGLGAAAAIPMIISITSPQAIYAQSVVTTTNRVPTGQCEAGVVGGCLGQCCTGAGGGGRRICCNNGGHPSCPATGVGCLGAPCVDTSSANCTD
jgi:hypothetical protein